MSEPLVAGDADAVSQYVSGYSKLAIKQKVSLVEAAGDTMSGVCPCAEACCEKENEYEVFGDDGTKILTAYEESGFCMRVCMNPWHPLHLHIHVPDYQQGPQVMMMERPCKCSQPGCFVTSGASCPAWGPCCQQEGFLHALPGGMPVGQKFLPEDQSERMGENPEQAFGKMQVPCLGGLFTPTVNIMNGGSEDPFAVVEGPTCCFGGLSEMCCDQEFPVSRESGKACDVAKIVKEKPEGMAEAMKELLTDSDLFTLQFIDPSLTDRQKTILMGSVLLIDYMFFETGQAFECDPFSQSCSVICCYCYMCGAVNECECECSGGGEGGE